MSTIILTTATDTVTLHPSAWTPGAGAMARQHRGSTAQMTRHMYGRFNAWKISDKNVARTDALKINCWWENNLAVMAYHSDTGLVSSGFIVNKSSPVKGFAEPYIGEYDVAIELEAF